MPPHERHGAKMGPRLAVHVSRAMTHHLRQSADTRSRIIANGANRFFWGVGDEIRATIAPFSHELAQLEGSPAWFSDTMHFLAHGRGEWQALLSYGIYGSGLSASIGNIMANTLQPQLEKVLAENPHSLLNTQTLADLVARGILGQDVGQTEANKNALSNNRFNLLVDASYRWPDVGQLYELFNRGAITREQAQELLRRIGYRAEWIDTILSLHRVHISPAQAADMTIRNIITPDEGRAIAGAQGVTSTDFDRMVLDTGEPPGLDQLLFAYRRGIIDRPRLEHGIRQARLRDEWIPVVESLRFVPMDTSDAIRAAVQGHLSDTEAKRISEQNGLDPSQFTPLLETAGEPIARGEALELYNRGLMDKTRVEQAIRESHVKNKYIPDILNLRRRLIPERTLVSMIGHGTLTHADGVKHLLELGFDRADAEALVATGAAQKTQKEKDLARADVLELYVDHALSETDARDLLHHMGYSETEATQLLALADLRRARKYRDALLSRLHSLYVAHHLTDGELGTELDAAGVTPKERAQFLHLWGLERASNARMLTEAQVIHLFKKGLLDEPGAGTRLIRMGYSPDDAGLLIQGA